LKNPQKKGIIYAMFAVKLNEVLSSKKSFISDRINFLAIGVAGLLNIIHWVLLYIKIKPGESNILLHYNVVYGPDFIQSSTYLYWIPLLALILLITNIIASAIFYKKEKLASYFINIASIPMQLVFLVATIVLILVNE
jgi:hypothetical protein